MPACPDRSCNTPCPRPTAENGGDALCDCAGASFPHLPQTTVTRIAQARAGLIAAKSPPPGAAGRHFGVSATLTFSSRPVNVASRAMFMGPVLGLTLLGVFLISLPNLADPMIRHDDYPRCSPIRPASGTRPCTKAAG